ncbi:hypothetical protein M2451_001963 [Dysgonomonas sp. PFB1-18]|uniref:hypothetical protein n=1 Tax=unclassified Dysgonomonas TaxID=2630389 RepID=UPI0024764A8A|nr:MULTISPECIES: hypothetical protein [unclassified Dysgonomonas]MDL2302876.1 hypothetical protein [Dysgonomonas sp. OttesenSCG-928-D17]MDH6309597.1 hypothetical protein [Dysgonomonas sp. PF1-14]MDH6339075.1 hypothetical protein [Dysgonomonas sp. PF1-16]MDH6380639.1 hypothetical protein [Dysgonomonas sp. PFB1-18]MDH6398135.1 hypothetical protein [Dysgonomonas sp. PF1-23]
MKHILSFISNNKAILTGMLLGLIAGYVYWYYFSCYWGTYPMSAECWVNCCYGTISGGFLASLIKKDM